MLERRFRNLRIKLRGRNQDRLRGVELLDPI